MESECCILMHVLLNSLHPGYPVRKSIILMYLIGFGLSSEDCNCTVLFVLLKGNLVYRISIEGDMLCFLNGQNRFL